MRTHGARKTLLIAGVAKHKQKNEGAESGACACVCVSDGARRSLLRLRRRLGRRARLGRGLALAAKGRGVARQTARTQRK
jgi:hypothetical protein